MNRRGFLGSILAACAAPAIVRADSLMRIVPRETEVITLAGDLIHGEIGHLEGMRYVGSVPGSLSMDQVRGIIAVMRERELKPNKGGDYLLFLPSSDQAAMLRALR